MKTTLKLLLTFLLSVLLPPTLGTLLIGLGGERIWAVINQYETWLLPGIIIGLLIIGLIPLLLLKRPLSQKIYLYAAYAPVTISLIMVPGYVLYGIQCLLGLIVDGECM